MTALGFSSSSKKSSVSNSCVKSNCRNKRWWKHSQWLYWKIPMDLVTSAASFSKPQHLIWSRSSWWRLHILRGWYILSLSGNWMLHCCPSFSVMAKGCAALMPSMFHSGWDSPATSFLKWQVQWAQDWGLHGSILNIEKYYDRTYQGSLTNFRPKVLLFFNPSHKPKPFWVSPQPSVDYRVVVPKVSRFSNIELFRMPFGSELEAV